MSKKEAMMTRNIGLIVGGAIGLAALRYVAAAPQAPMALLISAHLLVLTALVGTTMVLLWKH
jgi:hypothetical protein